MDELLKILKENAHETAENIAAMLGISADEAREKIAAYEKSGVIRGYQAIIDEDKLDLDGVTAVIEVKVTPEREGGFNRIADRIGKFLTCHVRPPPQLEESPSRMHRPVPTRQCAGTIVWELRHKNGSLVRESSAWIYFHPRSIRLYWRD